MTRSGLAVKATVHRILRRHGVIDARDPTPALGKRFEREAPNELWQMDFKGIKEAWLRRFGKIYPLTMLDDHSRFATGLFGLPAPDAEGVEGCLRTAFDEVGLPDAMLMDHGTPWWNHANGYGLTRLSAGSKEGKFATESRVGRVPPTKSTNRGNRSRKPRSLWGEGNG